MQKSLLLLDYAPKDIDENKSQQESKEQTNLFKP